MRSTCARVPVSAAAWGRVAQKLKIAHSLHTLTPPQAIVDLVRKLHGHHVAKLADFTVRSEGFNVDMSSTDDGSGWCFVASAALHSDEAVFDNVNATDAIAA